MRILIWHGYLLGGTGSNVYSRQLAREWARAGHEVTVLCQDPHPERYDLGGAEVVRPDVGGLLPVFVLDRYEGYRVELLQDCTRPELDAWVEANAAAVRALLPADLVLCNHVLLGGAVGAATGAPYAVKAHGSELEYSMRGRPELEAWGREVLAGARATFVGSAHIREVLEEVCGHVERVHEVPPGVDVEEWRPRPRVEALAGLLEEARRDPPNPGSANERLPDEGNAERLARFLAGDVPTVVYFGKLLHNKGVQVLLGALQGPKELPGDAQTPGEAPQGVGAQTPGEALQGLTALPVDTRAQTPGEALQGLTAFPVDTRAQTPGEALQGLTALPVDTRAQTPGEAPQGVGAQTPGEALQGVGAQTPGEALQGLTAFPEDTRAQTPGEALQGLTAFPVDTRAVVVGFGDYRAELEQLADPRRTLFTGPLEHRHLVHLLALADVCVIPSIFPEAFGMVAAEAAAAGCPPLVARHSGLAEVADGLEAEYPPDLRHLAAFTTGDVEELRAKLVELISLAPSRRAEISAAARRAAVTRWSWQGVADRLLELGV